MADKTAAKTSALVILLLALVVGFLFRASFVPNFTLFANDAPLGNLSKNDGLGFQNFTGVWVALNWLGTEMPSAVPNITNGLFVLLQSVAFSKFYAPISLFLLGLGAWFCLRRAGISVMPSLVGALAATLHTNTFSNACWGLPSRALCLMATFLAVGLLYAYARRPFLPYLILAGFATGLAVGEGYDIGGIYSFYIAAFAFFIVLTTSPSPLGSKAGKAALAVAVVGISAALFAAQSLSTLFQTQIKDVAGASKKAGTEEAWGPATWWSLPPVETTRVIVPGLFGYRVDSAGGANYWGRVGEQPGLPRHSGAGEYAGVLVVLFAIYAVANSFRRKNSPYTARDRHLIYFWTTAAVISLLLAYGKHAPFYKLIYPLPFFNTIRNPIKFMHAFQLALILLFGYGLQAFFLQFVYRETNPALGMGARLKQWWSGSRGFDKKWSIGLILAVVASVFAWLIYTKSKAKIVAHLRSGGFDENLATQIATFSNYELGLFVGILMLSVGLVFLMASGLFSGKRAAWAGALLAVFLFLDLGRANQPWIVYYNYKEKYQTNPLIELLRQNPHEHRVIAKLAPFSNRFLISENTSYLPGLASEWLQHHFQYYGIQSLDIIQMPRVAILDQAFLQGLAPASDAEMWLFARLWHLTNTRFILGDRGFLDLLNQQLGGGSGFRIRETFTSVLKPGLQKTSNYGLDDITVQPEANGALAVFEYVNALPRVLVINNWRGGAADPEVLSALREQSFAGSNLVLVSQAMPNAPANPVAGGSAKISSYTAKKVVIEADSPKESVLLLNDRYHPDWKVKVDGGSQEVLRCNYIMRGVYLGPGKHTVEFLFQSNLVPLYVSLTALACGLVLAGVTFFQPRRR